MIILCTIQITNIIYNIGVTAIVRIPTGKTYKTQSYLVEPRMIFVVRTLTNEIWKQSVLVKSKIFYELFY